MNPVKLAAVPEVDGDRTSLDHPGPTSTPEQGRTGRLRDALRNGRSIVGVVMVGFVVIVAVFGRLFAPYPVDKFVAPPFTPPSSAFPLGTDINGNDVLSQVLVGGWTVVWMSVVAATLGTVIGTLLGMLAGYLRGWVDEMVMRTADVWLAFPTLVFVLLFVTVVGREPLFLALLVGLPHIPQVARVIRGAALDVGTREYVESAKALGSGALRTNLVQILPNILPTLLVEYGLRIVWAVAALASLNVLGLGLTAPTADWGLMINENRPALAVQPLAVLTPLAFIAIFAVGVNLILEGIGRSLNVSVTQVSTEEA